VSYRLEFELEGLPKNQNARLHWRARHKENLLWKKAVWYGTLGKRPLLPLPRARLTLTRISSVSPDSDNIVAGFKPIIDGLVESKILANDKWENIGMPEYRWEKGAPKQGRVRIVVEEVACP
jgi:hypothetical protein